MPGEDSGPETVEAERSRADLRWRRDQLEADLRLGADLELITAVAGCEDETTAIARLQQDPFNLSDAQARHLVGSRALRRHTRRGRQDLAGELTETERTLRHLPDVPGS